MSRRLWKHRITDILDFIKKIQNYVDEMESDNFQSGNRFGKSQRRLTAFYTAFKSLKRILTLEKGNKIRRNTLPLGLSRR